MSIGNRKLCNVYCTLQLKAAIVTFNPREIKYMQAEPKFSVAVSFYLSTRTEIQAPIKISLMGRSLK
jgi:hypothetical protein